MERNLTAGDPFRRKYDRGIHRPGLVVLVLPDVVEVAVSAPGDIEPPVNFGSQAQHTRQFNSGTVALAHIGAYRVAYIVKCPGEDKLVGVVHQIVISGKVVSVGGLS